MSGEHTIVLVHGALCSAGVWEQLGKELDARGIGHVEMDLPSVQPGVDPDVDAHTDAAYVRDLLDKLDGPVVLCGNSYGGVVITEASAAHPNVAHLVYLAAFMPDADDQLASFQIDSCTPELMSGAIFTDDGLVEPNPEAMKQLCFHQAAPEVADRAMAGMRPMAMGRKGVPTVTAVGWRGIPSTYIVCTEDRTIRPEAQREWARHRATNSVEVPFDHCPQVSHPAEVADMLAAIAAGASPSPA